MDGGKRFRLRLRIVDTKIVMAMIYASYSVG